MQHHSNYRSRCIHKSGYFTIAVILYKSKHKHFRPAWIQFRQSVAQPVPEFSRMGSVIC